MEIKEAYDSAEPNHGQESAHPLPPVVRSRRERVSRVRMRSDNEGHASQTDSGSGDHFSPTNVTEVIRSALFACRLGNSFQACFGFMILSE